MQCNRKVWRYQGVIKSRPLKKVITPWYLQTFLLHCIFYPSSMDDFWLPLGIFKPFYYIVLSVLLQWRGNQKSSIEGQTIQCNRKVWRYQGIIKGRPLKKVRQYNVIERFEDTKGFKPFYYIVLSVLLQWTTFDYPLVSSNLSITLYFLSVFNGRLLITQRSSIEESQTIQCNRKVWRYQGVIKSRPLKKDRQYNVIKRFEDIKG
jgi:hypothetical protein